VARHLIEVFLSSTALDLKEHRDALHAELSSTGVFHCVRQEDFGPQNAGAVDFCRRSVKQCEIFLGLVGLRRGWEPPGDNENRSITEMEHDWAREAGRRQFIYVAPDNFKVAGDLREPDEQHARQEAFRRSIIGSGERIVSQKGFDNPERFAADVVKHLLCQHIAGNLIGAAPAQGVPPQQIAPDDQRPPVAAAVKKLAEDNDVDLLALAKNPQGIDIIELEAKLKVRAETHEAAGQKQNKTSAEYWRHIGALTFLHNTQKALDAYRKATTLDPENCDGWSCLGMLQYRLGEITTAHNSFETLRHISEKSGDVRMRSISLSGLGVIFKIQGDLDNAETSFRKSLSLSEECGNKNGIATAYGNLGTVYETRGDLHTAEEMFGKALALHEELGHNTGTANIYDNLTVIHGKRGDFDKAEETQRKALSLHEECGDKEGAAAAYGNLGLIHKNRGELEKAEEMQLKSLTLDEELGHKEGVARAHANLGNIHYARGDFDKAQEMHSAALELNEELGRKEGMAIAYGNLGNVHDARGDIAKAEEMYRKALALNEELSRKEGMALAYSNLAGVYETMGDQKQVCECLRNARDLWREMNFEKRVADTDARMKRAKCPGA